MSRGMAIGLVGMAAAAFIGLASGKAAAADAYYYRFKGTFGYVGSGTGNSGTPTGPVYALSLGSRTFRTIAPNRPYTPFNFSSLIAATQDGNPVANPAITWDVGTPSSVPTGMTFHEDTGILDGTPTAAGDYEFQVVATYQDKVGQQTYLIKVGTVYLEVVQVSAGRAHTCAVTTSGGAKCWGQNTGGQLGNGGGPDSPSPVDVTGLTSGVTEVHAGNAHTCAIHNGAVKCWGAGGSGQLGNGRTDSSYVPVLVNGLGSGVTSMGVPKGGNRACVVHDGAAKCWGMGDYGAVGNGSNQNRSTPTTVNTPMTSGVSSISVGTYHSCAVTDAGAAWCWGYGQQGQLGHNAYTDSWIPVQPVGLETGVAKITAGHTTSYAVMTSGAAKSWGHGYNGQLGTGGVEWEATARTSRPIDVPSLMSGVRSIAATGEFTCAVTTSNNALCWGDNAYGNLGDGTTTRRPVPTPVSGLGGDTASITVGLTHACAATLSGDMKCWGEGQHGKLGNGLTATSHVPVRVQE